MGRLKLSLACGDYDRTRALEDGTVRPEGIELTYLRLPVEETFFRMLRHREFDVAEMSLSSYLISLDAPDPAFVALPVFTSRMFRHGAIYVRTDAGITAPEQLRGRLVGMPEYQLTACVWVRGILAERHGLPVDAVSYRTGGQEAPGRVEKLAVNLPERIRVQPIPPRATLSDLLLSGDIDALYTPRMPQPLASGDPRVRRLFADVVAEERAYFAATGIFPIMHVVVVRRDLYERHPWIVQSLYKAFAQAKDHAVARLADTSALAVTLPWLTAHWEQARDLLGADFWSYGMAANREPLRTFARYHHEQGLSARAWEPDEMFAPEASESFVI